MYNIYKYAIINNERWNNMAQIYRKSLNRSRRRQTRYLKDMIEKRYAFITIFVLILFSIIVVRLFQLQILNEEEYNEKLVMAVEKNVESTSSPRGRIYDRNHKLLVDNEAIKTIYYKKQNDITTKEEVELAYTVSGLINLDYSKLNETMIKEFWHINNKEAANKKITEEEWKLKSERKLSSDDIKKLIMERITEEELSVYTEEDKEAAYLYYLMNKGYSYAEKVIKNIDVTEEEYAIISENIDILKGFNTKLDWDRIYLYGDTLKVY